MTNATTPHAGQFPPGQLHAALEHAPIGAILIDAAGAVCWANAAAAAILAEPGPDALQDALFPGWLARDDGDKFRHLLDLHFSGSLAAPTGLMRPFLVRAADGSFQTVELTFTRITGVGESDGPCRMLLYLQSVTRQVTAERRFSQIFETLPLGLLVVDCAQHIVQANASAGTIFGYAVDELIGHPLDMLLPERYRRGHVRHFQDYSAAPQSRMMGSGRDLTGLHRSGQEIPVEIALSGLANAAQPLFLAIVTDISGRKRSENALQQTNAQLEEFTYVASHDLRSPLRGIGDLVSWIRDDLGEERISAEIRHNFDRITLRIARCEQMIDDLLIYARAGVRDPHVALVDPRELVDEAISMAQIPEGFAVEIDVKGGPLPAPRTPLLTSLRNLVSNAAKHHGDATGRIRIAMQEEGRFSVFSVEDDGRGIDPGSEERIFKLFHRGAANGTEGDGVGLAVTRRMINAHGGMITVEGQGPLGGARFEIHWPRILLREFDNE